jgi:hypothetical protein
MSKKIIFSESQISHIVNTITNEKKLNESYYDSEKSYSLDYIKSVTKKAPRYLKKIISDLPKFDCPNGSGDCVKIPQVIFQYIKGNF